MKKVPIVLLILGGVLANFIGMVGCICMSILLFDMSILLFDIWSISCVLSLVIGGHVTGAVFLQRLYQRRWQIGKAIFWLCAGLPSALIGMSSFAVVLILDKLNYFSGFLAGLGEFVLTLAILIYSGAFFVVLGIVLLIIHVVSHIKNRKLPEKT